MQRSFDNRRGSYVVVAVLVALFIFIAAAGFLMFQLMSNAKNSYTLFIKCGEPLKDNFCVELYPRSSRFTSNTINRALDSDGAAVMNCPANAGTGSEFMNCIETLKSSGCSTQKADFENGRFYLWLVSEKCDGRVSD